MFGLLFKLSLQGFAYNLSGLMLAYQFTKEVVYLRKLLELVVIVDIDVGHQSSWQFTTAGMNRIRSRLHLERVRPCLDTLGP